MFYAEIEKNQIPGMHIAAQFTQTLIEMEIKAGNNSLAKGKLKWIFKRGIN
jgi:hypothetical protein